jgi:hypothetical protein
MNILFNLILKVQFNQEDCLQIVEKVNMIRL